MHLRLGSERLFDSPGCAALLDGKRIGVVCHPASVDRELRHVADQLAARDRVQVAALFGPQHGFRAESPRATSRARGRARFWRS